MSKDKKEKIVRVCKKCSGFDVDDLGTLLKKKEYETGCIGKCLKKKPKLKGKVYGYIRGEFIVCDTKEEFFSKISDS